MKKILVLLMCSLLLVGCSTSPSEYELEKEAEREAELDAIKREAYEQGHKEGYYDAIDAMISEMPWYLIDVEEMHDSLNKIYDGDEYADELRDLILDYCELHESTDFVVEYSDSMMDYDY